MINQLFIMDGYGVYVWSAFLFTMLSFISLYLLIKKQLIDCKKTLEGIKSKSSSSSEAALILSNYLIS